MHAWLPKSGRLGQASWLDCASPVLACSRRHRHVLQYLPCCSHHRPAASQRPSHVLVFLVFVRVSAFAVPSQTRATNGARINGAPHPGTDWQPRARQQALLANTTPELWPPQSGQTDMALHAHTRRQLKTNTGHNGTAISISIVFPILLPCAVPPGSKVGKAVFFLRRRQGHHDGKAGAPLPLPQRPSERCPTFRPVPLQAPLLHVLCSRICWFSSCAGACCATRQQGWRAFLMLTRAPCWQRPFTSPPPAFKRAVFAFPASTQHVCTLAACLRSPLPTRAVRAACKVLVGRDCKNTCEQTCPTLPNAALFLQDLALRRYHRPLLPPSSLVASVPEALPANTLPGTSFDTQLLSTRPAHKLHCNRLSIFPSPRRLPLQARSVRGGDAKLNSFGFGALRRYTGSNGGRDFHIASFYVHHWPPLGRGREGARGGDSHLRTATEAMSSETMSS